MLHGSVGRINWRYASFPIMVFCSFRLSSLVQKGSADVFAGHLAGGLGFLSGFVFPFDTKSHGIISHVRLLNVFLVQQFLYCDYLGRDRLRKSLRRTKHQFSIACHD
jgi:hypothetical protein